MLQYISDIDHYNQVLARVASVKRSLWIGTADIKDLHVKVGETTKPFLAVIACLFVAVWKCASFMPRSLDRTPVRIIYTRLERVLCPHVHFKMLIFDCKEVYIGSANLTGAGIGMKTADKRNFEAGILTDAPAIVERAMNQFDNLWIGRHCKTCKCKDFCPDPIV